MRRKGFIYTLEAVIAASLMLGTVVFVVPEVDQSSPPTFRDINTAIFGLDEASELDGNRSDLNAELQPYKPRDFNLSVRTSGVYTDYRDVSGGEEFYLEEGSKELMLWIDSSSDFQASFDGMMVFDRDQEGYHRVDLGSQPGYLNFSGTADARAGIQMYGSSGSIPASNEAYTSNYVDYNGSFREVQVVIWR